ncbi:general transcription factor II-I repeat domain-containing protein 2A-like [Metopolophium dirhodum]|uniref:general transcription factor II-I repeat domain-containing protein 2A-like n=1 Tax=Metopolophium dirhodum TaxID=44670 RepID=UPI00299003AD|nr:general transcription factor II-I repeat domain-containing protein 2A-like [Metopolophium dirhodum]
MASNKPGTSSLGVKRIPKKLNVQRHYNNHNDIIEKYPKGSVKRTEYIKKKTNSMLTQQSIFTKQTNEKKNMVLTSYEIAFGKCKCGNLILMAKSLKKVSIFLQKMQMIQKFLHISKQISCNTTNSKYFSLELDDNPQLRIFIRSVNSKFKVTEELLGLEVLETSTKGTDIFNKLKCCCVETLLLKSDDLIWSKLENVCTDGAPCMIVSRCINKIKARPLNHRLFRALFEDAINESGEQFLFCEVRWLAKGKALERFWNLKDEVIEFLEKNNELPDECELMRDKNWLINIAFLTDILGHLNILNKRVQGEGNLFPALVGSINSFMSRLRLFETTHDLQKYNHNMQLEIIELQSPTVLKCKYKESSEIIEFWKCLPEEDFPELHSVAVKLVCRFGSTYICEKSFSRVTFIKNKYRTELTNSNLKNVMLLYSTKLKPNYEEIISMKQIQHTSYSH